MRFARTILTSIWIGLSACAADPVQIGPQIKTPFHPDAPPRGLSESGIDFGDWSDPFSPIEEQRKVEHRFSESVEELLGKVGDTGLVKLLESEGFECAALLDSMSPSIWHCKNVVVYDVPMSSYMHWEWMVTLWDDKISVHHFSEARLY